MSLKTVGAFVKNYTLIGAMLAISWILSSHFTRSASDAFFATREQGMTLFILCGIVTVLTLGFIIYELAKPTPIPSFVLAIVFGFMCRDIFSIVTESPVILTTLIITGAVLILFEGGLETPFVKFKSLIGPILSLAIFGTIINALLFSYALLFLTKIYGITMPIPAIILLGATIASTDPAAIIPSFQSLVFKKSRVKHIAISESAINDVVGAVLVGIFLTFFFEGSVPTSIIEAYANLMNIENGIRILHTLIIGTGVGLVGFVGLHLWNQWKAKMMHTEDSSDSALFIAVPLFCYLLATILGGSGYLAVFLCGLFFHIRVHFTHVEHYFSQTIEGFMKPLIFMLLGAMVQPESLAQYAHIGIVAGLIFMFVLRPLIVMVTLLPFMFGNTKLTWCELLFLSFVRETGVIPGVLLITITLAGVPGSEMIMAIGLWIILLTLIIEPPVTPLLACKLGLAKQKSDMPSRKHTGPVAVLCSRGYSFPERMQTVVDWADGHQVANIALLHCPEERYSEEFVEEVKKNAEKLFKNLNKKRVANGQKEMNFEILCGPGLLQDNIDTLIEGGDVSIIFVGSKMLDYRMEDVKRLQTPFFFMS